MTESDMLELMKRFRVAYGKGDSDALRAVTTDDFEWHQHAANDLGERPSGRLLRGIDELMTELSWRRANWQDTKYENLEERAAGDLLVQTFVISGVENGVRFHAKAVDLYPVRDDLIARKDTYWKYLR